MFTITTNLLLLIFAIECLLANPIDDNDSVNVNNAIRRRRRSVFLDRNIKYLIDSVYPEEETNQIKAAIAKIEDVSCVKFTQLNEPPTDATTDYVHVTPLKGCFADVGRIGGRQTVSLALECLSETKAVHELLHSLGMWHEHQRWDRDKYITVNFENIIPSERKRFEKLDQTIEDTFSLPYDYHSIMHYNWQEYSIDGNVHVFESNNPDVATESIGGKEMSELDKHRLNKLYNCDAEK